MPFPSPGDLPNPGIQPAPPTSPALAGGFFTTGITWRAPKDTLLASQGKEGLLRLFSRAKKNKKRENQVFHLKSIKEGMAEQTAVKTCFTYTYRMSFKISDLFLSLQTHLFLSAYFISFLPLSLDQRVLKLCSQVSITWH